MNTPSHLVKNKYSSRDIECNHDYECVFATTTAPEVRRDDNYERKREIAKHASSRAFGHIGRVKNDRSTWILFGHNR